jgi:hypothetical protein
MSTKSPLLTVGTKVEILRDSMSPYQSPNTRLVSAARACGFEWGTSDSFMDAIEEKLDGTIERTVTWVMNAAQKREFIWAERTADGTLVAKSEEIDFNEFRNRFLNLDWISANPDHPISYLRATHRHHGRMLATIKTLPQHVIVRNGARTASIPTNATPEERARALRALGK